MGKGKEWQTAEELMHELEKDPNYLRTMAEKENKQAELKRVLDEDQIELKAELAEVGINVESVWDLVNTSSPYPKALPVLLRHLFTEHHRRTREGIARALIVKEGKGIATRPLIELFERLDTAEIDFKWVLAHAIAATATNESIDEVLHMARDKRHGMARGPLLKVLHELPKESAVALLEQFANDPEIKSDVRVVAKELKKRP